MKVQEIVSVDTLQQPSPEQIQEISRLAKDHYKGNIYYYRSNGDLSVVSREDLSVKGLIVGVAYSNPQFTSIPEFLIPQNMYSWAQDNGQTALDLFKAFLKLSSLPVVSDLQISSSAKRFLKKHIERGSLQARTLDLDTGDVSQYDPSVFEHDDESRVLILDQPLGVPVNESGVRYLQPTLWNHKAYLSRLKPL